VPDAAMTPFRSEKDTNWEGAFRVPAMIRWPGRIRPDKFPMSCSRARLVPDAAGGGRRCRCEEKAADRLQRRRQDVQGHLDGFNQLPYLTGQQRNQRAPNITISTTTVTWWRCGWADWKLVFGEQRARATC